MKRLCTLTILIIIVTTSLFSQNEKMMMDNDKLMAQRHGHSITKHSLKFSNGNSIDYKATAGYTILKTEEGKERAKMFFIAYTKDGPPLNAKVTGRLRWRKRPFQTTRHFCVQRRPGLFLCLATHGRPRPKTHRHDGHGRCHSPALPGRG